MRSPLPVWSAIPREKGSASVAAQSPVRNEADHGDAREQHHAFGGFGQRGDDHRQELSSAVIGRAAAAGAARYRARAYKRHESNGGVMRLGRIRRARGNRRRQPSVGHGCRKRAQWLRISWNCGTPNFLLTTAAKRGRGDASWPHPTVPASQLPVGGRLEGEVTTF